MELIIMMWITQIVVVSIVMFFMMKMMGELSNKLLQIEIIKKAENIEQAEKIGLKNIAAEQKLEKALVENEEKLLLKVDKLTPEELKKAKEEAERLPL